MLDSYNSSQHIGVAAYVEKACLLRCMHSQHQCYGAITTAEHHVLGRGGLCRAACAWEGELWMFVSGGGVASVHSMPSKTDVFIFREHPTALNKNITLMYGSPQLYILYSSPVIQTIPTHALLYRGRMKPRPSHQIWIYIWSWHWH